MASERKVMEMWANLAAAYPAFAEGKPELAMEQSLRLYMRLLADLPDELLEMATYQHIATSKFWPTIAELREAAAGLVQPHRPTGLEAWGAVREAIRRIGHYHGAPDFGDSLIDRAVRAMGWQELCLSEQQEVDRAHFLRAYETLLQRERDGWKNLPVVTDGRHLLEAWTTNGVSMLPEDSDTPASPGG